MARRMITEFGMSPKLGRVHYSETRSSPFLAGGGGASEYAHSEETIREIDLEVRRTIDTAYDCAHEILANRRPVMEHLTRELLERETIEAPMLQTILDQYKTGLRLQIKPGTFVEPVASPSPAPSSPLSLSPNADASESSGHADAAQSS